MCHTHSSSITILNLFFSLAEEENYQQNRQNETNVDRLSRCTNDVDNAYMYESLERETVLEEKPKYNSRAPTIQKYCYYL